MEQEAQRSEHRQALATRKRERRIAGLQAWVDFITAEENNFPKNLFGLAMLLVTILFTAIALCLTAFFVMWIVEQAVEPFGTWSKGLAIHQSDHVDNYHVIQTYQGSDWVPYTPGLSPQEAMTAQEDLRIRYPEQQFRLKDTGTKLKCWYVGESWSFDSVVTMRSPCFLDYNNAAAAYAALSGEEAPLVNMPALTLPEAPPPPAPEPEVVVETNTVYQEVEVTRVVVVPAEDYADGYFLPTWGAEVEYIPTADLDNLLLDADSVYYSADENWGN